MIIVERENLTKTQNQKQNKRMFHNKGINNKNNYSKDKSRSNKSNKNNKNN